MGPDWIYADGYAVIEGATPVAAPPMTPAPAMNFSGIVRAEGSGAYPPSAINQGQGRAMAKRAAQLDAQRNLLEQVNGVQINSNTYVRDFVTQSDQINSQVSGYLQGAQVIDLGDQGDGTYKVAVEIDLSGLNPILGPHVNAAPAPQAVVPSPMGVSGQAKLMAKRGAEQDARRNMLEVVKAVQIESGTYVRDFVTQSDEINARVMGYIRNCELIDVGPQPDGTYKVQARMDANMIRANIR